MSSRNSRRQHKKRIAKEGLSKSSSTGGPPHSPEAPEKLQARDQPQSHSGRHRAIGEILSTNLGYVLFGLAASIAGIIAIPIAIWGNPLPSVDPEIRAATDAYSSPFTVFNKSGWYAMADVRFTCVQGPVEYINPNMHGGFNVATRPIDARFPIPPNGHETFPCLGIMDLGPARSGEMYLQITYTTRFHSHIVSGARSVIVKETYEQGKWIDGEII